ncbi:ankyrin repeat protein [Colletotrichum camelliae]|nr:ankyrin repeat protein [Colletotrichum camelliae]
MDLEADVRDIESLQWLAKNCAKLLEALLLEENAQAEEIIAKDGHWVSRQYAEFNLWCVKVGVNGQGLRSIDVRLKDVPETCAVIRDLLKALQSDLKKIQQPVDSIQHLKKADIEADNSDSGSDSSSLSFDSLSSLGGTESRQGREDVTSEGKQTLTLRKHVEDTVDRLHGHALQIDKAGAKHRQERVKVYVEKDGPRFAYQGYKEIAYRKAKSQFPSASDVLCHRMAESFVRRRIRFDYLKEHQKKRAVQVSRVQTRPPVSRQPKSTLVGNLPRVPTAKEEEAPKGPNRRTEQQPKDQQTIYSATERTKLESPVQRRQERAESVVSIALRHPGFPPPPKITGHSFHCPYCRLDFRAVEGGKARWSQHVMQDFEPYFCPISLCEKPFDLPNNFDGLLHHLQDHVEERYHIDLPEGEHQELSEEDFEKCITQRGHISDENLVVMKRAARRKGAFLFDDCPFCGGYPDVLEKRFPVPSAPEAQVELRRHIRQHMQDMALFLPPYREDVFDDDGDLQSSVFSRERGENSSLESFDDFQMFCDRDACDCKNQGNFAADVVGELEMPEVESTIEPDTADFWVELFPELPRFDRSDLAKEDCAHDEILHKFLTSKLRSAPELVAGGLGAITAPTQRTPESFSQRSRRKKRSTILESVELVDYDIRQREYCQLYLLWIAWLWENYSNLGRAFVYCDQDITEPGAGDDAYYLLTNILKQLAEYLPSTSPALEFLYNMQDVSSVPDSISDICRTIERVAEEYSKILIIVDAVDEIQEGPRGRMEFLSEMVKLQKACGLNIFITSRPIVNSIQRFLFLTSPPIEDITDGFLSVASDDMNLPQGFKGNIQMSFCATDEDIRKLIQHEMPQLPYPIRKKPKLQKRLVDWVIDEVDGTILIAEQFLLQLKELVHANDADRVEESIWTILETQDVDNIYCHGLREKLLRRIRSLGHYSLAMKAMNLVLSSRRHLKTFELEHALSKSFMKPLEEDRPAIIDILLACAGLLEADDWNDDVYLSPYISEEFLEENSGDVLTSIGGDLATLCIDCVSSEAFDAGPCSTEDEFQERLRLFPFYSYAASNWAYHAPQPLRASSTVVNFLSAKAAAQAAGQALMMLQLPDQQSNHFQNVPKNISGLHLAAYFGLDEAARLLLQNSIPDLRDSHLRTPLMYAVEQGCLSVSGLLIQRGADASARDIQGRTPLHLAAMFSHPDLVNLLLDSRADVDAIDNLRMSPLHIAAGEEDSSIATKLLTWGASADERDYMGWTPLLRATLSARIVAVGDLLLAGAFVNAADENSISVLSIAAMLGQNSIVSTLLNNDALVDIRDREGWTPLLHATANGHESTVGILLDWGADIHAKEEDGWDPLLIATSMGHESIVEQLLRRGADLKCTVRGGYSPLLIAAYRGYDVLAGLLCERSSPEDREAKEQIGQTPLLVATRHGHEDMVDLLLDYEADIEAKEDKFGQTPLLLAVRLGHLHIVRLSNSSTFARHQ